MAREFARAAATKCAGVINYRVRQETGARPDMAETALGVCQASLTAPPQQSSKKRSVSDPVTLPGISAAHWYASPTAGPT